jgi:hypothetical protein
MILATFEIYIFFSEDIQYLSADQVLYIEFSVNMLADVTGYF